MVTPALLEIKLRLKSRVLEVVFDDNTRYELPWEYLRVYSPSAEVQGHGPGETALVLGKENVRVNLVEPVGNYAVRLHFDDGHNTGLYTFNYLHKLGLEHQKWWGHYVERAEAAKKRKAGH
jgi:DUF971 family protein